MREKNDNERGDKTESKDRYSNGKMRQRELRIINLNGRGECKRIPKRKKKGKNALQQKERGKSSD